MDYPRRLFWEVVVVGATLAAAVLAFGPLESAQQAFAIGALIHLAFEASGLNRAYCASGAACGA